MIEMMNDNDDDNENKRFADTGKLMNMIVKILCLFYGYASRAYF